MVHYVYRPVRFYITVFAFTWGFWIAALLMKDTPMLYVFMILGLLSPAGTAVITVLTSKSRMLKTDLKRKIVGFYRIKPLNIVIAVLAFFAVVAASIGTSVLFGGSPEQFSFTEDFSFSIGGSSSGVSADALGELTGQGVGRGAAFVVLIAGICLSAIALCIPLFKDIRQCEKNV